MKNSIFARCARAFFIFWHFEDVLVLSTTWNDLFCSCVDDVSIWWQIIIFDFLCPKRWFQFNSRIVRTHFSSIMTSNNWKVIAETRSYIFRWRSCFHRRRVCLSSLLSPQHARIKEMTKLRAKASRTNANTGKNSLVPLHSSVHFSWKLSTLFQISLPFPNIGQFNCDVSELF